MMTLYVLKPILLAIIHALTYYKSNVQLILLCLIEFHTFFIMASLQILYNLYKVKSVFCLELSLSFQMFVLNILIHLKYNIF